MNKFVINGWFETEKTFDEIVAFFGENQLNISKVEEREPDIDNVRRINVYYDSEDFYFSNDILIPEDLLKEIFEHGIVYSMDVRYPRASKYGVPVEATDIGGLAFISEHFSVNKAFEVFGKDTGDDSATSYLIVIDISNELMSKVCNVIQDEDEANNA